MTQLAPLAASRQPLLRAPEAFDGAGVWKLIAGSGSLDENSLYCNLLQCSHFAQTCVLAEVEGRAVGWMSGHILPQSPDTLFVWQICVDPSARGLGVARQMIAHVLARDACRKVTHLECTITEANNASWALFRSMARVLDAPLASEPQFLRQTHLNNRHDSEHRVNIGPFRADAKLAA